MYNWLIRWVGYQWKRRKTVRLYGDFVHVYTGLISVRQTNQAPVICGSLQMLFAQWLSVMQTARLLWKIDTAVRPPNVNYNNILTSELSDQNYIIFPIITVPALCIVIKIRVWQFFNAHGNVFIRTLFYRDKLLSLAWSRQTPFLGYTKISNRV